MDAHLVLADSGKLGDVFLHRTGQPHKTVLDEHHAAVPRVTGLLSDASGNDTSRVSSGASGSGPRRPNASLNTDRTPARNHRHDRGMRPVLDPARRQVAHPIKARCGQTRPQPRCLLEVPARLASRLDPAALERTDCPEATSGATVDDAQIRKVCWNHRRLGSFLLVDRRSDGVHEQVALPQVDVGCELLGGGGEEGTDDL